MAQPLTHAVGSTDIEGELNRIGPFTIDRVLGKGGMGTVYLARDEELDRDIAIKTLAEDDDPNLATRFLREARAAAAVRHPNVATIYRVGTTEDGVPYIAMEYCPGSTLSDLIKRRQIDSNRFLRLAVQIAAGLDAAHTSGILHRDIKSANIIVEANDLVKILDFGLARPFDTHSGGTGSDAATVGRFFGTLPYLSPEQANGRPSGVRSDLFSLGTVLYEMATGRLPFNSDNPLELLNRIRTEEPEPFDPHDPELPGQVIKIISRLLQKNPKDRYQNAAELHDDLIALLGMDTSRDTIVPTRPLGTGTIKLPRTIRRRRILRAVAVVASIVLFTLIVFAAVRYGSRRRAATPIPAVTRPATPIRSLAVLPFKNLGQSNEDSFLSIGLADALTTHLQQIEALQVRPTSSVTRYFGESVDTIEAARELSVEGLLEGNFLIAGDQVRVSLQLTDSRTGYGVWATSLDGPRRNLIELLDKVSSTTTTAVEEVLSRSVVKTGRSEPFTPSAEAFEYYLRSKARSGSLVADDHAEQIDFLSKAIDLDPDFAAAYAEMAIALSLGQARGLQSTAAVDHDPIWYARQAVRLDPNLPEAHLALGRALVRLPDRFSESARENLAALRLAPNMPDALFTLVSYFVSTGNLQNAGCIENRFLSIDPTSNDARTRGYWKVNAVDPQGALALVPVAASSEDTQLAAYDIEALSYLILGDVGSAAKSQQKAARIAPEHYIPKSLAAMIAAADGDRESMERWIGSFEEGALTNHWAALRIALARARIGDRDEAIQWLERSATHGNHSWYFVARHPWFEPLHGDPGFQDVLDQMKADLDDVRDDVIGVYRLICPAQQ